MVKILGLLGAGTAIFCMLGFTIVQSFIRETELEGLLSFSNDFYVDAGGKFLLEMIRAPILAPYISFVLLIVLFYLISRPELLFVGVIDRLPQPFRHRIRQALERWERITPDFPLIPFWFISTLACLYVIYFGSFVGKGWFESAINIIFPAENILPETKRSFAFFSITTPVIVILGYFIYQFRKQLTADGEAKHTVKWIYITSALFYVVLLTAIPITYGKYLYDWKVVEVDNPSFLQTQNPVNSEGETNTRLWLLGQFHERYVFLRQEFPVDSEKLIIKAFLVAMDVDQIKRLSFNVSRFDSLRLLAGRE